MGPRVRKIPMKQWPSAQQHAPTLKAPPLNEPLRMEAEPSDHANAGQLPLASDLALLGDEIARLENDRRMIGFEIHDGVVQGIVASIMQLEAMSPHLSEPHRERAARVIEMLRGSVAEARRIMQGLGPAHLEEAGLIAAIEELIVQQGPDRCPIRFRHDVISSLIPLPLQSAIFRIVQEGISNINRHSQASAAEISLIQSGEHLRLTLTDNGVGFRSEGESTVGFGLRGITERARLFGVRPNVTSAPDAGTTIEIDFPLIPSGPESVSAPD